jgi:hypothetical protein
MLWTLYYPVSLDLSASVGIERNISDYNETGHKPAFLFAQDLHGKQFAAHARL